MRYEMKRLTLIITILILITFNNSEAHRSSFSDAQISFQTFYYSLAPYGEWIEIEYGIYAWRPIRVRFDWAPYLIGRWVWTPYGWYWDSYEPFGWAVYHYGRWYHDDYYGWIWIPDYVWAPAWVEWRFTDGYIGWSPLPPYASFSISIGIRFTINWYSPYHYWHFVPLRYFCGYEVHKFIVAPKYKYRIYRESKYSIDYRYENGYVVNRGIDRSFIERHRGRIVEARVEETTRLRDFTERRKTYDNRVIIYRPNENEINRNERVRVIKSERKLSLDVNKLTTPRERIDTSPRVREENERKQIDRIDEGINRQRIIEGEKERKGIDSYNDIRKLESEKELGRRNRTTHEKEDKILDRESDNRNEKSLNIPDLRKEESNRFQYRSYMKYETPSSTTRDYNRKSESNYNRKGKIQESDMRNEKSIKENIKDQYKQRNTDSEFDSKIRSNMKIDNNRELNDRRRER